MENTNLYKAIIDEIRWHLNTSQSDEELSKKYGENIINELNNNAFFNETLYEMVSDIINEQVIKNDVYNKRYWENRFKLFSNLFLNNECIFNNSIFECNLKELM